MEVLSTSSVQSSAHSESSLAVNSKYVVSVSLSPLMAWAHLIINESTVVKPSDIWDISRFITQTDLKYVLRLVLHIVIVNIWSTGRRTYFKYVCVTNLDMSQVRLALNQFVTGYTALDQFLPIPGSYSWKSFFWWPSLSHVIWALQIWSVTWNTYGLPYPNEHSAPTICLWYRLDPFPSKSFGLPMHGTVNLATTVTKSIEIYHSIICLIDPISLIIDHTWQLKLTRGGLLVSRTPLASISYIHWAIPSGCVSRQ